jgi:hypothetical protein
MALEALTARTEAQAVTRFTAACRQTSPSTPVARSGLAEAQAVVVADARMHQPRQIGSEVVVAVASRMAPAAQRAFRSSMATTRALRTAQLARHPAEVRVALVRPEAVERAVLVEPQAPTEQTDQPVADRVR